MMRDGRVVTAAAVSDPDEQVWIYRWFDAAGTLLYVGTTNDVERRTKAHRARSYWWPWAARVEASGPYTGRVEAEEVEAELIRAGAPIFNLDYADPAADARARSYRQTTPRLEDEDDIPSGALARQVWLTPKEWERIDALTTTGRRSRADQPRSILRRAVLAYLAEREPEQV